MGSIDTTIPVFAVVVITFVGLWSLPWSQREVAESARAFATLGRLVTGVVWRTLGLAQPLASARGSLVP